MERLHLNAAVPAERAHRRASPIRRILRILFLLPVVLLALGFGWERIMRLGDGARYPMPGRLYSVDGYDMYLQCVGDGSPTVIFIGGGGAMSYSDMAMQRRIGPASRACVYDRAGVLLSEPRPELRTAWQLMTELRGLLTAAAVEPPYVLVGASNGGLYARAFADAYRGDVAGMVLVDPRFETLLGQGSWLPAVVLSVPGNVGLFRLVPGMICPGQVCDPQYREPIAVYRGYTRFQETGDREIREGLDAPDQIALLQERLGTPGALGEMPLVVLISNQDGRPLEELPQRYQQYIADNRALYGSLTSNLRLTIVPGGHGIASENPALVERSILDVLESARTGAPLPEV